MISEADGGDGRVRKYLDLGADAVVGAAAAGASLGMGPAGAAAVARVAPFARSWFAAAAEFADRQLSNREQMRSSSVLAFAIVEAAELVDDGRRVREDGFFDAGVAGRSVADEVLEGVLLVAQREPEEAKMQLLGRMLARIAFDDRVERALANRMIRLVERLSYRQLCIIGTFEIDRKNGSVLRPIATDGTRSGCYVALSPVAVLLHEIWELHREGMLIQLDEQGRQQTMWDFRQINPGRQRTAGASYWFRTLMDLGDSVPDDIREDIVSQLHAWVTDVDP